MVPEFSVEEAVRAVNLATVLVSILAGVSLATVLRAAGVSGRVPGLLTTMLVVVGWSFFGMLGTARALQGSPTWEVYVGVALLWSVYSVSAAIALRVGR